MNQVFLSYKSAPKDRVFADRLRAALEAEHLKVRTEREFVEAGEIWERALLEQLDKVAAVIFLIGPDGRVSEEQRNEATAVFRAEWGKARKIPLIPVITAETDLPPFLREVQAIEVTDLEKGWSEAAQKIKHTLRTAPAEESAPPAGESEQQGRLIEIQRFADSLKEGSNSYSREKLAR
jgi:hypothetical protein